MSVLVNINQDDYKNLDQESKARITYNFLWELYGVELKQFIDYWNADSDNKPMNYEEMKFLADVLKRIKKLKTK